MVATIRRIRTPRHQVIGNDGGQNRMMRHFSADIGEYEKDVKMYKARVCLLLPVIAVAMLWTSGCDKKPQDTTHAAEKADKKPAVSDALLVPFQSELLDMAFDIASSIPAKPYIKDRGKAQEAVVDTCLKMDQPVRAVRFADKIGDWRRGLCYANTAYYLAQHGYTAEQIQKGLDIAEKIANMDHGQKWHSDRIKTVISQTCTLLGKTEQAKEFSKDVNSVEKAKMLKTSVVTDKELSFEELVKKLDDAIMLGSFETTISALYGYTGLFDRYYDNPERRNLVEEKIKKSWEKIPLDIRIELLEMMAGVALNHADRSKSLELVNEAQTFLNDQWPLENYIPVSARLIGLRSKVGDVEKAKTDADALSKLYDERGAEIIDIHRAETLYPLAEAYHAMGNTQSTLTVYKKAVEGGALNSVTKYQAEDISAICCSMASSAVEPDAQLWARIKQIKEGLGRP